MGMKRRTFLTLTGMTALLAACGQWKVGYDHAPDVAQAAGWRVTSVKVTVPESLSVSEEYVFAPKADIVWHGEPAGDRRAQVAQIVETGARRGAAGLKGSRPVRLDITMLRFHALSKKAREKLSSSGVHSIDMTVRVIDVATGQVLAEEPRLEADLPALSGKQAIEAERQGQTQKVRITNHIAVVMASWLGTGPDARGSFSRIGA